MIRRSLSHWLVPWGWLLLLILSPLFFFSSAARTPVLLVVPLVVWAQRTGARPLAGRTPLDGPLLLLALMVLVSLWATFDIAFSLIKVSGLVLGIGLYYAVTIRAQTSGRALRELLGIYLLLGVGVAGVGLLSTRWSHKLGALSPLIARLPPRLVTLPAAGEGLNPNEVAGVLLWVAPLLLALTLWMIGGRGRQFIGGSFGNGLWVMSLALAAFFTSGVLILTQSRGGLLGFGVAMFLMAFLTGRQSRPLLLGLVAVGLLAALAGFVYFGPGRLLSFAFGPIPTDSVTLSLDTLAGRLEIWSRAIYGIQDFPFTGMGMNTFRQVVHVLYPLFLIGPNTDIAHAHNIWLQTALDLGLPGLAAYIAVWLITLKMLLEVQRVSSDPLLRAASIGMLGCLAGYFVYGLLDTVALGARPGFLWWMLLALATATWKLARVESGWDQS